jgi:polysaccharide deacetylase 2 family uncharacterized protein YibQ
VRRRFNFKTATWILSGLVILQALIIFLLATSRPQPKKALPKKALPKAVVPLKGKIAIVLDDFGYNLNNLALLKTIREPLTVSVLPNLGYSQVVAEKLNASGFEVILHLPLEPKEKYSLEKDTILTSMKEEKIKGIISQALKSIPFVRGVSNHMGSKATEDEKTMNIILSELKRRRLYFLDSLVTGASVGRSVSRKIGLGFARRDIFLDNEKDADYIKQQLDKLKARAERLGQAIGIGHDRKLTIEVLKEVIPKFKKLGFKFVYVSDLVR